MANERYKPRCNKNQSAITKSIFSGKAIKLPKEKKELNKDKFRLDLKNRIMELSK